MGIVLVYRLLSYPLVDDVSSQSRVTFHDYYETDPIDILFVGPSHTVRFLNAEQMTKELGISVYNLGTIDQELVGSYYLIKDAIENKGIKKIYFEISISRLFKKHSISTSVFIITDYFKNFIYKVRLVLGELKSEEYLNAFRLRRSVEPLKFSMSQVTDLVEKKKEAKYTEYKGDKRYNGRGQWTIKRGYTDDGGYAFNVSTGSIDDYTIDEIKDRQIEYFRDIIRFCNERNVELVIYIPPYTEVYKQYYEDYWLITDMVKSIVSEEGGKIIDLNLVKDEYLKLSQSDFYLQDHPNYNGGIKISSFLAQYIRNPNDDYFVSSVSEKYPNQDDVTAVAYLAEYKTKKKKYYVIDKVKGKLQSIDVKLWAQGYHKIPAKAKMWTTTYDESSNKYIEDEEIVGTKEDEYVTDFSFETNALDKMYIIKLYNPDTGEQIYQAYTKFDED